MSIDTVSGAIRRIKAAEPRSPIAVFWSGLELNVVFAKTVATWGKVMRNHPELIGVYDKTMKVNEIRMDLREYTGEGVNYEY